MEHALKQDETNKTILKDINDDKIVEVTPQQFIPCIMVKMN